MSQWFSMQRDGEVEAITAVSLDERATQYGDGLFETIAIRQQTARLLPLHLERLTSGCRRLGLAAPAEADIETAIAGVLSATGRRDGILKLIVAAGAAPRGYTRAAVAVSVWLGCFDARPWSPAAYRDGIRIRRCNTRLAIQPQLAGIKTLNRLEQVLARAEWSDENVAEGLMMDTDERIICGTMSNVFLVIDNRLMTPAITRCGVAGVMRRHLLEQLDQADIDFTVDDIPGAALDRADEVFLTNSQFGLLPVRRCGDRRFEPGPWARDSMQRLADAGIEECRR